MASFDSVRSAGGGEIARHLAAGSGLDESAAEEALGALLPEVGRALRRAGESRSGAAAIHALMQDARYRRYYESPPTLAEPAAAADGERVLDEVLDEDGRRELVRRVAAAFGSGEGEVRALLPRVAALALAVLGGRLREPPATPAPAPDRPHEPGAAPTTAAEAPGIPWFGTRPGDHFDAPLLSALARLFEGEEEEPPKAR